MRAEVYKTKKENELFIRNVERGKALDRIQAKERKMGVAARESGNATSRDSEAAVGPTEEQKKALTFVQVSLAKKRKQDGEQPDQVKKVLSRIF